VRPRRPYSIANALDRISSRGASLIARKYSNSATHVAAPVYLRVAVHSFHLRAFRDAMSNHA